MQEGGLKMSDLIKSFRHIAYFKTKNAHLIDQAEDYILSPSSHSSEELGDGGFILKTHQNFSVHTLTEEFEIVTITGYFAFVFE